MEKRAFLTRVIRCVECDKDEVNSLPDVFEDLHSGEMICKKCGLVVEMIIDQRPERTFAEDEVDLSRVGGPINELLGPMLLETYIGSTGQKDTFAKEIIKTSLVSRAISETNQSLHDAFSKIDNYCARANLPTNISERAKVLFKKCNKNGMKGKSELIAATIFVSLKNAKISRTMNEICALTKVSKKDLGVWVKRIDQNIEPNEGHGGKDFIPKFCSDLGFSFEIEKAVTQVVSKIKEKGFADGKSPVSIVGAAIYMISQLSSTPKSKKQIGDVIRTTQETIKKLYIQLYKNRHELITSDMKLMKPIDSLPVM